MFLKKSMDSTKRPKQKYEFTDDERELYERICNGDFLGELGHWPKALELLQSMGIKVWKDSRMLEVREILRWYDDAISFESYY